jgi:NTE family protein
VRVNLTPAEKNWGPNYLAFGLGLYTDLNGDSSFNLSAMYRRTWINALGAEWKTLVRVGKVRQLHTEFYQPLIQDSWAFVAPYVSVRSRPIDIYLNEGRFTRYHANRTTAGVDVGSSVSRFGEIRLGVSANRYTTSNDDAASDVYRRDVQTDLGIRMEMYYDQFDKQYFPTSGGHAHFSAYRSLIGKDNSHYSKFALRGAKAIRLGKLNTLWSFEGVSASEKAPLSEYSMLGGLFNLSGYQYYELLGKSKALARVMLYYPVGLLSDLSDRANYLGLSLEAGSIFNTLTSYNKKELKYSAAAYWATDTALGPFYVAYARGDNNQNRFYILLGSTFE